MSHTVTALREAGGQLEHVEATDSEGRFQRLRADAYVLAMGSLSPLYAAPLGIRLPINPAKGYSVTMPVKDASPLIGKTRLPNFFLSTGHGTLGWTHACGSGKSVARIVSGLAPEVDFAFQR